MMKNEKGCSTQLKIEKENQGPIRKFIFSNGVNQRLDKFLTEKLSPLSRSQIQKMIKAGEVLVNGKMAAVHRFLRNGDIVNLSPLFQGGEVAKRQRGSKNLDLPPTPSLKQGGGDLIKIIEDNNDFLIVNKPAGLLVHPTQKNETDTLVDWLLKKCPELKKIGEDPSRPAIVHRLDKEVSGLMLIPKTQAAFDYFKQQFKEHTIIKKYIALVYGEVKKDEGKIDFPISRSKTKDGLFAAHPHRQNLMAKKALTRFKIIKRFKNYTLLEIQILTGRTHQIRVHLSAYGCPVVGDKLYLNRKIKPAEIGRIFLHASCLSFVDLNGDKKEFASELPKELSDFKEKLN